MYSFHPEGQLRENAEREQLEMMDLRNSNVYRNIFLRDSNAYGVASKFTFTVSVEVRENICGLGLRQDRLVSHQS